MISPEMLPETGGLPELMRFENGEKVKTPADGLTGLSDEENLGISYRDIHRYIRLGSCGNAETDEKIRKKEKANMHKRRMPTVLDPFGE